jgi:hypothetical protein
MKKQSIYSGLWLGFRSGLGARFAAASCLAIFATAGFGQDLPARIRSMKASYAGSGSIVAVDERTLVIEPNMPGPVCALPRNEAGKTSWSYFAFPLASITVPLAEVDESFISEDLVFTGPDAALGYKPGDIGDTTMVVVMGVQGKQFHTLKYDREKLARLGPGVHNSSDYGQTPDDVEAFGLTFADHAAAEVFVAALKHAVTMAKTQAQARLHTSGR